MERDCDLCKDDHITTPAVYDAKTLMGPWAYVCEIHYQVLCHHSKGLTNVLADLPR